MQICSVQVFLAMSNLNIVLKLFGGLILLYLFGRILSHFLKLDKYYEEMQKHKDQVIQRGSNRADQNLTS